MGFESRMALEEKWLQSVRLMLVVLPLRTWKSLGDSILISLKKRKNYVSYSILLCCFIDSRSQMLQMD